jgi:hypothetical protein
MFLVPAPTYLRRSSGHLDHRKFGQFDLCTQLDFVDQGNQTGIDTVTQRLSNLMETEVDLLRGNRARDIKALQSD